MDQQDGPRMALTLTQPRFCVVRVAYDGSGLYAAYGPCETAEDAARLTVALREIGIEGDNLAVIPMYGATNAAH